MGIDLPQADIVVEPVDASSQDLDQYLAGTGSRGRNVFDADLFGATEGTNHCSFHVESSIRLDGMQK
ncbi:hypothetical protein D3C81_1816600 [compost metagenome]